MKCLSATLLGSTLALVLAGAAWAGPMPVPSPSSIDIDYNWAPAGPNLTPATATPPGGGGAQSGVKIYQTGYTGDPNDHYVFMTNDPLGTVTVPPDGTWHNLTATNIWKVSSGNSSYSINQNYSLSVVVTDDATNSTKTLTFYGNMTGAFSHNDSTVIDNFLAGPGSTTIVPSVKSSVTMSGPNGGTETVTVWLTSAGAPPAKSNAIPDATHGFISVKYNPPGGSGGGPGPGNTPEPSTLVLSFLGLSGLGMASWRRWRARRAA
jgi:hypothetical protein